MITEFFPTGKDLKFSGGVEARTFFVAKYLAKDIKLASLLVVPQEVNAKKTFQALKFLESDLRETTVPQQAI